MDALHRQRITCVAERPKWTQIKYFIVVFVVSEYLLVLSLFLSRLLTAALGPIPERLDSMGLPSASPHPSFHYVCPWVWGARTLHAGRWGCAPDLDTRNTADPPVYPYFVQVKQPFTDKWTAVPPPNFTQKTFHCPLELGVIFTKDPQLLSMLQSYSLSAPGPGTFWCPGPHMTTLTGDPLNQLLARIDPDSSPAGVLLMRNLSWIIWVIYDVAHPFSKRRRNNNVVHAPFCLVSVIWHSVSIPICSTSILTLTLSITLSSRSSPSSRMGAQVMVLASTITLANCMHAASPSSHERLGPCHAFICALISEWRSSSYAKSIRVRTECRNCLLHSLMHATADSAKYCRDAWLNVERLCSRSVSYQGLTHSPWYFRMHERRFLASSAAWPDGAVQSKSGVV